MIDELDARVRALEAERLRRVPPRPPRRMPSIDRAALDELVEEATGREPTMQQTEAAAARVGIRVATARRKYEPLYQEQRRKNRPRPH